MSEVTRITRALAAPILFLIATSARSEAIYVSSSLLNPPGTPGTYAKVDVDWNGTPGYEGMRQALANYVQFDGGGNHSFNVLSPDRQPRGLWVVESVTLDHTTWVQEILIERQLKILVLEKDVSVPGDPGTPATEEDQIVLHPPPDGGTGAVGGDDLGGDTGSDGGTDSDGGDDTPNDHPDVRAPEDTATLDFFTGETGSTGHVGVAPDLPGEPFTGPSDAPPAISRRPDWDVDYLIEMGDSLGEIANLLRARLESANVANPPPVWGDGGIVKALADHNMASQNPGVRSADLIYAGRTLTIPKCSEIFQETQCND